MKVISIQESLGFCAMYLWNVQASFNKHPSNFDECERVKKLFVFVNEGPSSKPFKDGDLKVAYSLILNNYDEVYPFPKHHEVLMKTQYPSN